MIKKDELDCLVEKYETKDFIKNDPIQFPHRFRDKQDVEVAGFIASLFAYGNRKMFIAKLNDLFNRADNDIANYIKNGDFENGISNWTIEGLIENANYCIKKSEIMDAKVVNTYGPCSEEYEIVIGLKVGKRPPFYNNMIITFLIDENGVKIKNVKNPKYK